MTSGISQADAPHFDIVVGLTFVMNDTSQLTAEILELL